MNFRGTTFLKAFCQEGVEPSALFNWEILNFKLLISLPKRQSSLLTSLDFKIENLICAVSGETWIQKSLLVLKE